MVDAGIMIMTTMAERAVHQIDKAIIEAEILNSEAIVKKYIQIATMAQDIIMIHIDIQIHRDTQVLATLLQATSMKAEQQPVQAYTYHTGVNNEKTTNFFITSKHSNSITRVLLL